MQIIYKSFLYFDLRCQSIYLLMNRTTKAISFLSSDILNNHKSRITSFSDLVTLTKHLCTELNPCQACGQFRFISNRYSSKLNADISWYNSPLDFINSIKALLII